MQIQTIQSRIYEVRGQKVMLDFDLAELYDVETRVLNQAVKRNVDLFPKDFMFKLTAEEWQSMSSQIVMTSSSRRPKIALPFVFTEHGVAMLSNVLKSKKARLASVTIVRAFIALKQLSLTHTGLKAQLKELENRYNKQFKDVYEAINYLLQKDKEEIAYKERRRIGFKRNEE
jgi:hypothetical protein